MSKLLQIKAQYGIVGQDRSLDHALRTALQVSPTDVSVLIYGESGTGKEVFSKIIHQNSKRKHNRFIAVNCGAIPEGTIDSELFGHEKGAFTGAIEARKGYFEVAHKGTLFLDEIAEMPLATQARLLRVLESGEFIRVGSSSVQRTDVRVVAATNLPLQEQVAKHKFRQDLYYRLNTISVKIPALRARKDDIGLLFAKFAADFSDRYGSAPLVLSEEGLGLLSQYHFPGNIRELRNVVEQISLLEAPDSGLLTADRLASYLPREGAYALAAQDGAGLESDRALWNRIALGVERTQRLLLELLGAQSVGTSSSARPLRGSGPLELTSGALPSGDLGAEDAIGTEAQALTSMEEMEKGMIQKALRQTGYKRKEAADLLKISERTLYRKIREYDL